MQMLLNMLQHRLDPHQLILLAGGREIPLQVEQHRIQQLGALQIIVHIIGIRQLKQLMKRNKQLNIPQSPDS
ncbi:hypothetical protein D3C71_1913270 [compost metagenome]